MNFKKIAVVTGTIAGILFYSPSSQAADVQTPVNAELLTVVLKAANVLNADSKLLNVYPTGKRVTAMIQRNEITDDRASKIDAMFIARSLFDAFPSQIDDVRVLFSTGQGHDGKVVNISANLVNDFTAGKIPAKDLVSCLQIEQVQSESSPDLIQGPCEERRLLIWHRIKVLQDGGTGIKPFTILFRNMEEQVKAGNNKEVVLAAENLEEKLSQQEEQVKLARKAAAGRGVIASSRINANSSDKSLAGGAKDATSKRADGTETAGTVISAGQKITPPATLGGLPIAEFQNAGGARFMDLACRELEQRKDIEAQRYRDRKSRIEDTYKNYDKSKAEAEYNDFKIDFLKKFGLTPTPAQVKSSPPALWGQSIR